MDEYGDLLSSIRVEFPKFRFVNKTSSMFMRFISLFLWAITFGQQKAFMDNYVTTIGQTVYTPANWESWAPTKKIAILSHERVHMRQARKYSLPVFALCYLFLPFPIFFAYCRARFEWEAYKESMRVRFTQGGPYALASLEYKHFIVSQFVTGAYGWMWPFRSTVEGWYDEARAEILESSR